MTQPQSGNTIIIYYYYYYLIVRNRYLNNNSTSHRIHYTPPPPPIHLYPSFQYNLEDMMSIYIIIRLNITSHGLCSFTRQLSSFHFIQSFSQIFILPVFSLKPLNFIQFKKLTNQFSVI